MSTPRRQFTTGLEFLDRRIGGGIETGGLLALTAPPSSQSELLLAQFLSAHRTTFVSTTRPEAEVRNWAEARAGGGDDLTVVETDAEDLFTEPDPLAEALAPESLLVVDTANALEAAPRDRYLDFLNRLKALLRETDSVGVMHCIGAEETPPRRALTLNRADHVWEVQLLVHSREIKTRLLITKARRGQALTEPVPILLTDQVRIDTSRRIA